MVGQTTDNEIEDPHMSPQAFAYAISGLTLAEKTKETAYLVLVDDMPRPAAREKTGVSADTLNKALARIAENFKQQLASHELVYSQRITTPEMDTAIGSQEALIVESRIEKKTGRKKR